MLKCLLDYILLRGTCLPDVQPTSGFWLDNLEGMSVDNVAAIAPEKLHTAANVVSEKLLFAGQIVQNRLRGAIEEAGVVLNRKGKLYDVCKLGTTTLSPTVADVGIKISKKWLSSPLAKIYVKSVRLQSATTGVTTIKISDVYGVVLWSKEVTLPAGQTINVQVNKQFGEDIIFVTADATNVELFAWDCNEKTECRPCVHKEQYLNIEGWNGNAYSPVGYLSACVSLDCSDSEVLCLFLDRMGLAILHQLGVEILKEWASPNNRLNIIKTHGEEWAKEKRAEWERYSIEYMMNEMQNVLQELKTDKFCYNCEGRFKAFPMLP
jgi:hypothetical protein